MLQRLGWDAELKIKIDCERVITYREHFVRKK